MRIILAFTSVLVILLASFLLDLIGNVDQDDNEFTSYNFVLLENNEVLYLIGYTESGQIRKIGLMKDIFPTYSESEGFNILIKHIKENGIMTFSGEEPKPT